MFYVHLNHHINVPRGRAPPTRIIGTTPLTKIIHIRNTYAPLEMTPSAKELAGSWNKNRDKPEPGDAGLRGASAPRGFFSNTYDASTTLRRPRKTLTQCVTKLSFLTHHVLTYNV